MTRPRPPRIPLHIDTVQDFHRDADAADRARRAEGDHGLGRNADRFADLDHDAHDDLQVIGVLVVVGGVGIACAILGWLLRGWVG